MIGRLLDRLLGFLSEPRRRNVYQVAAAYLVAGFVAVQLAVLAAGGRVRPAGLV